MSNPVEQHKPSRMNIKSTPERIAIFYLSLDVNHHERDETLNELMDTLESDVMLISPDNDVMSRVTAVFG